MYNYIIKDVRKYVNIVDKELKVLTDTKDIISLFHIGENTRMITDIIDRAFFVDNEITLTQWKLLNAWKNLYIFNVIEQCVNFKYDNKLNNI